MFYDKVRNASQNTVKLDEAVAFGALWRSPSSHVDIVNVLSSRGSIDWLIHADKIDRYGQPGFCD